MSKFLTPERVAAHPDAGCFSPKKLSMLKRIFDSFCSAENITSEQQRDELAANLLEAGKFSDDEKTLTAVMRYDIAGYRK